MSANAAMDIEKSSYSGTHREKAYIDNTSPDKLYRVGGIQPKIYKPLKESKREKMLEKVSVTKENEYSKLVDVELINDSSKGQMGNIATYRSHNQRKINSKSDNKVQFIEGNEDIIKQLGNAHSQSTIITISALQKSLENNSSRQEMQQVRVQGRRVVIKKQ